MEPMVRPEPTDAGAAETEGWWPNQPPDPKEPFNSPRRWAGRLAFPLLALGIVVAWRGVQVSGGSAASALPEWGWWTLAAGSVLAGLALLRVRHRTT
jgi:hypothetical protein